MPGSVPNQSPNQLLNQLLGEPLSAIACDRCLARSLAIFQEWPRSCKVFLL